MNAPCPACLATPSSIDGHPDLGVKTIGSTMLTFECRCCHARWARSVVRGRFSWSPIDACAGRSVDMGTVVPPRSDPFQAPEPTAAS
ncbi:MAG: hypothetical protein ABIR98_15180 [Usitatibacter sp.]